MWEYGWKRGLCGIVVELCGYGRMKRISECGADAETEAESEGLTGWMTGAITET